MASAAKPSKRTDKSETDEAHKKSVAELHARLDAEQKLKAKMREEERACFEETARILGHKPPSAERAKAAARRVESITRIARMGERAGFVGEAFADDYGETKRGQFVGGQIMGGGWPWDDRPYDIASNPPWSSYRSTVFHPPYRFEDEYNYPADAHELRGADRRSGKVFAKSISLGLDDGHRSFRASVGVTFSLPANRFDGPFPRVSGPSPLPPYRTSQARIFASVAGTKRWMFHAESAAGECSGLFPISTFVRPIYDDQEVPHSTGAFPTDSATGWRKLTRTPPDHSFPDPFHWSEYDRNTHWPAATALPAMAISPWFTVDNYHTYDIYVGVGVVTQGYWRIGDDRYSLAVAEMEAVIQSITIEFTG
jgi:hypothetical protein